MWLLQWTMSSASPGEAALPEKLLVDCQGPQTDPAVHRLAGFEWEAAGSAETRLQAGLGLPQGPAWISAATELAGKRLAASSAAAWRPAERLQAAVVVVPFAGDRERRRSAGTILPFHW